MEIAFGLVVCYVAGFWLSWRSRIEEEGRKVEEQGKEAEKEEEEEEQERRREGEREE